MNNNPITHTCPDNPEPADTFVRREPMAWVVYSRVEDTMIAVSFCPFCGEKLLIPADRPGLVKEPDFKYLVETCETYLDNLVKNGYADEDDREYIYEAAMTALYGGKVFEFINSPRGK